jgi:DNA-binding transcriptional regulator YiaG
MKSTELYLLMGVSCFAAPPTKARLKVKVEVRATGLRALREKRGLTQRQLAHDLGISQN